MPARMRSGVAVMGAPQYLPGYCVLLRCPQADSLKELSSSEQGQFPMDMTLLGDAINAVYHPLGLNHSGFAALPPSGLALCRRVAILSSEGDPWNAEKTMEFGGNAAEKSPEPSAGPKSQGHCGLKGRSAKEPHLG